MKNHDAALNCGMELQAYPHGVFGWQTRSLACTWPEQAGTSLAFLFVTSMLTDRKHRPPATRLRRGMRHFAWLRFGSLLLARGSAEPRVLEIPPAFAY
jgi:hypothetical protein